MDTKQLRSIIKEEVTGIVQTQLQPIKKDLKDLREGVDSIKEDVTIVKKDIKELREDVDALRGDVADLQDQTKGVWDKIDLGHKRNKREIDEIKTHIGLTLMPDIPEV